MLFFEKYRQVRALKSLFLYKDGSLKPEARIVIAWLRDECNARGYRVNASGASMLFDPSGKFDAQAVCYSAGERRIFDLIISRLSLDEQEVFNLVTALDEQARQAEIIDNLTKI